MKLHLGCWHRYIPGYIHVDLCEMNHIDFISDIGDLKFINDNTVDYIYCSHALEYKDYDDVENVLKEWKRVLKKNGLVRIAVPDFDELIKLYYKLGDIDQIIGPLFGKMTINGETKIHHKSTFNFLKIKYLAEKSGFLKVERYDWTKTEHANLDDHSQAYYPKMDKENGTLLSLNVQFIKK
tara:strand:- start:678 stop:1220 length:543 start_codon:yes stop_codon:yes gene_type:complete